MHRYSIVQSLLRSVGNGVSNARSHLTRLRLDKEIRKLVDRKLRERRRIIDRVKYPVGAILGQSHAGQAAQRAKTGKGHSALTSSDAPRQSAGRGVA